MAPEALLVLVAAIGQLDPEVVAGPVRRDSRRRRRGRAAFPSRPPASRRRSLSCARVYDTGENEPLCVLDHLGLRRRRAHQLLDLRRTWACPRPASARSRRRGRTACAGARPPGRAAPSRRSRARARTASRRCPGFSNRLSPTRRSYCMCVCAVTMHASDTPAVNSSTRSAGVAAVTHSSSLRGEPWQKSVGPSPSTSTATCSTRAAARSRAARRRRAARAPTGPRPSRAACAPASSRSELPRTKSTRSRHGSSSATVSRGSEPQVRSPQETIRSGCSRSSSASTASSAVALPCTSASAATRTR